MLHDAEESLPILDCAGTMRQNARVLVLISATTYLCGNVRFVIRVEGEKSSMPSGDQNLHHGLMSHGHGFGNLEYTNVLLLFCTFPRFVFIRLKIKRRFIILPFGELPPETFRSISLDFLRLRLFVFREIKRRLIRNEEKERQTRIEPIDDRALIVPAEGRQTQAPVKKK